MSEYRNKKLLELAKVAPKCFRCGADNDGTVVAAHANMQSFGKGMGIKSADWAIAYCCHRCHDIIDGRAGKHNRAERNEMWIDAHVRSVGWLFESGKLVVSNG